MRFIRNLSATKKIEHAAVYELMLGSDFVGYEITADDGYIIYDSGSCRVVENPESGIYEVTVNSSDSIFAPPNIDFDAWQCCTPEKLKELLAVDF